jgi:hypothetical protein
MRMSDYYDSEDEFRHHLLAGDIHVPPLAALIFLLSLLNVVNYDDINDNWVYKDYEDRVLTKLRGPDHCLRQTMVAD